MLICCVVDEGPSVVFFQNGKIREGVKLSFFVAPHLLHCHNYAVPMKNTLNTHQGTPITLP